MEATIYTVLDETTYRRYPVTATKGSSLESVWKSQAVWFKEGVLVTIIGPDGKSETFRK